MCNPAALFLASGGVQAAGAMSQGRQAEDIANYNAALSEQDAVDALNRGSLEEARYRQQVEQVKGQQKVAFGARNVARSGTALDLLSDTALLGEEDALTIRKNARTETRGLNMQAKNIRAQGRMYRRNANFAAGSTLLTSGAQAYGWNRTR